MRSRPPASASREYFRRNPDSGVPFEQPVADLGFTMDQIHERSELRPVKKNVLHPTVQEEISAIA